MAAVTTTSASTSMVGVPTVADPPPGYPALPLPMDMTLPPNATNPLAGVGVGRGKALQTMWATIRPPMQASTTSSTASGIEAAARGRSRERSSPQGSRDQSTRGRRPRSSTRGSRKQRRGIISQNPMDDLDNYVPSGWKRDLLHIVGCHYAHQIGP